MSRLEKARAQKQQGKKRLFIVSIIVLVIIAAGIFYLFFQDGSLDIFSIEEPDFIDKDRTEAFIDFFELTYVRVYLKDEMNAAEVTVNGENLSFNDEHDRWDIVLSGYESDDELVIIVTGEDREQTQEVTVIIEELDI